MAGFQVANFSFGKNIKDDERQRAIAAMNNATTRRGQDMQAAQADANREENARQFDEKQAAAEAARAEGARQFDAQMEDRAAQRAEGARQFDEAQAQKKREYADRRGDMEHAKSWDDAIKMQQMERDAQEIENRRLAFEERNAKLDSYFRLKEEEDAQMANRKAAMEGSYGNMAILAQLQNGIVTRKQVDQFNKELLEGGMLDEGREYNYIGTVDPTTGKPFSDGKLHFVRYALDGNGQAQIDQQSGRPLVEIDNPLNAEIRSSALTSYFGDVKEFMGKKGSSMSPERMNLEYEKERGKNARASARNSVANQRIAASIAKDIDKMEVGMGWTPEQTSAFKAGISSILMNIANIGGGEENQPATAQQDRQVDEPAPGRTTSDIRTDKHGVQWKIVRDENGKPIGKKRVQ